MAAHAGETARETGDFRCERRHETVHVTRCPNCVNQTFDTRRHEPGTKSS